MPGKYVRVLLYLFKNRFLEGLKNLYIIYIYFVLNIIFIIESLNYPLKIVEINSNYFTNYFDIF